MNQASTSPNAGNEQWLAIIERDPAAVGRFVYAVRTTGVYCHPNCRSRRPNRKNVRFFARPRDAEAAGFRACQKCRPNQIAGADAPDERVLRACRFIERAQTPPSLADIAQHVGLNPQYLHRLFRKQLGVTPKQYSSARRVARLKKSLIDGESVTRAVYQAGYASNGRCYAQANGVLGMTPKQYQGGGQRSHVRFATVGCRLGRLLVAVTEKGVCEIALGDDDVELRADLMARLPAAEQVTPDSKLRRWLAAVVALVDSPAEIQEFPLDIRGTAFQQQVWRALQAIPPGETRSYSEIAAAIGRPDAVRAVASAVAANPLAVAVPCHRVIHKSGTLSGYRWGKDRKKRLLAAESRSVKAASRPKRR
jgi:AraC family transcriptional regulator, regulatory protein of adaptative response / methylated-DNA-[protein]-cysteine methyltransferase